MKEGDVFKVISCKGDVGHRFSIGDFVELAYDDLSESKRYRCVSGTEVGKEQWVSNCDLVVIPNYKKYND